MTAGPVGERHPGIHGPNTAPRRPSRNSLRTRFLFALLYFSEGAPIGYAWWALPTQLRADGVDIGSISLLVSLLAIPWALKALWAPLIDHHRGPRWTYRSWILASQFVMGASLLPLVFVGPSASFWLTVVCMLLHAFSAATQDVSIDALCIAVLPPGERGRANGWMQTGMLVGRALFGGGTLIVMSTLGSEGGLLVLIGVVWIVGLVVSRSPVLRTEPPAGPRHAGGIRAVVHTFSSLIRIRTVWYGIGFALLSGAVFEGLGSVSGPFLIDSGETTATTGFFFAGPAVVAMSLGALLGGTLSDRIGAARSARYTLLGLFTLVTMLSLQLLGGQARPDLLVPLLGAVYLGIGLFTASSYALYMDVSVEQYRATSFSAYMGATNLCESWSAFAVGRIVPVAGYGAAFTVLALVSLVSLPILNRLTHTPTPSIPDS